MTEMQDLIQNLFKSLYVAVCCGAFVAALTALVIFSRHSSVSRAWEPLVSVVNGTLERKYRTAVLQGSYQEYPIQATLLTGGAEDPDTFQIRMQTAARGANWLLRYGSEKFLDKDRWYIKADHPILQERLDQSGIPVEMQQWNSHPTIRYERDSGTLLYEENGKVPNPEHFRAQLALLVHLMRINDQVNTGERFIS